MKPTYEELAVQLANAESKCRALAAENSSKSRCLGFFASVIKSGEKWTSVCEHEYSKALKNPATDAFLAEARAQGVEMLADKYRAQLTALPTTSENIFDAAHVSLRYQIFDADEFAAQLRKGAAQ